MRENVSLYSYKVKLRPNNKQKTKMFQTLIACINASNFVWEYFDSKTAAYNALSTEEKENFKKLSIEERRNSACFIENDSEIRKKFTLYKKDHDDRVITERSQYTKKEWKAKHLDILFYDVSNDALKQAVKDEIKAWRNYFKGLHDRPRRKNFNFDGKSYYVDSYKIKITDKKVKLEKLTTSMKSNRQALNYVKLSEYNRIPLGITYYNARVRFKDGGFYLTVSVDSKYRPTKKKNKLNLEDGITGFDLNIDTINGSDGSIYKTVRNDKKYKKLETRRKSLERIRERKYRVLEKVAEKQGNTYTYKDNAGVVITRGKVKLSKNYKKLTRKINKIKAKQKNYKLEKNQQILKEIFKEPMKNYVLEDLDVKHMQKQGKANKGLQIVGLREFINLFKNKTRFTGIRIIEADTNFASSKTCNNCGYINKNLQLKDRKWICPNCNKKIDRDYNAALNLRDYGIKVFEKEVNN